MTSLSQRLGHELRAQQQRSHAGAGEAGAQRRREPAAELLTGSSSSGPDCCCPVPELALALSAAVCRLGCRVVVRRVTDTRQYWSKSMGNTFAICTLPGGGPPGGGLVVDPNFREQFSTAHMTQRYRWVPGPYWFRGLRQQGPSSPEGGTTGWFQA